MPLPIRRPRHRQQHDKRKMRARIGITVRPPLPLDRGRPSVAQLPEGIVEQILRYLQKLRPQDVLTVASLSSYLYRPARYVQHHIVCFDLSKRKHIHDRLDLIVFRGLLPAIRTFEVKGRYCNEPENDSLEIINRLADMLSDMGGLRVFGWQVGMPIPSPILKSLRPGVDLCTSVSCQADEGSHVQAREFLDRLVSKRCLRTLSVQIEYIQEQECLKTMRILKKVLLSCPNLTKIPLLDVHYPRGPCQGWGPPVDGPYCGLGLSAGERPPALEELGLRDYPWGIEGARYCQGYPERGHEWNYWAKTFDWSRLVRLNNVPPINPLDPSVIAPKMTNLRQVNIEGHYWEKASFLDEITSPLNNLNIPSWSWVSNKSESINGHGATLQKLKIHQKERNWGGNGEDAVTDLDLAQLSNGLPHLEELALDFARDRSSTQWPYGALDAISKFPSLRAVELWFPLGLKPPAPTPLLTISSARHLFSYLRERSRNIRRLILHSGAPSPPIPLQFIGLDLEPKYSWSEHTSVTFVCNMAYDGNEEGRISVTCPEPSPEMNMRLERLAQKVDRIPLDPRTLDKIGLLLKSALDGPLTRNDWAAWVDEQEIREREYYRQQNNPLHKFILKPLKAALEI